MLVKFENYILYNFVVLLSLNVNVSAFIKELKCIIEPRCDLDSQG